MKRCIPVAAIALSLLVSGCSVNLAGENVKQDPAAAGQASAPEAAA